ncbi:MAG TPA: hypothetical protein VGL05_29115, partial [Kribbella sp.]
MSRCLLPRVIPGLLRLPRVIPRLLRPAWVVARLESTRRTRVIARLLRLPRTVSSRAELPRLVRVLLRSPRVIPRLLRLPRVVSGRAELPRLLVALRTELALRLHRMLPTRTVTTLRVVARMLRPERPRRPVLRL